MSAALALLESARLQGLEIKASGNHLKLRALHKPPDDVIAEVKLHKSELLALLTPPVDDTFEERAALVEYGAGVPREWAEGFARLDLASPPKGFDKRRWRTLIDDGGKFLDRWGAEAARLGWSALDVFGAHPIAPAVRYDAAGLVLLIGGSDVLAVTERSATIRRPSSENTLTYLRTPRQGAVALWMLS